MVLVVIMLVNLNRLLVRYRDWVWRCHWYRHFNTDGDFNTDRNVDRYFYSDWNLDRNLDGVGLGDWNGLRHSVRYSVGLRDGDRCSNWVGDTVAVAFAESFFKTLFIVMGLERSFIGRQTHSL
jgi:hypothetical protein